MHNEKVMSDDKPVSTVVSKMFENGLTQLTGKSLKDSCKQFFTKDDIMNKDTNLLFFGNFYKMNLKDFTWGMEEMMNNRDFLYGSMIKDFYFLGQVLGRKYKLSPRWWRFIHWRRQQPDHHRLHFHR